MIPHAIILAATYEVINCCIWDRVAEWSPPPGTFVVRLDNQPVQPSIGWVWNPHTKTFGLKAEDLPTVPFIGAKAKANPVRDPIRDIPHRAINWVLCDRGQQSPLVFHPKRNSAEEVYEDRMKLPEFAQREAPNV